METAQRMVDEAAKEAEVAELTVELDALKKNGKGNTSKADVVKGKIKNKTPCDGFTRCFIVYTLSVFLYPAILASASVASLAITRK